MKILQIGKFYPIRGGVEKVMYDLMLGLSERKIFCDMLCATTEDQKPGVVIINPYARLLCLPAWCKLAATMLSPDMVFQLRKIKNDYDVIHIHHPDPMACLALFFSGYKGKVIVHWHSDILKQKLLLKLFLPLQKWLIKRADLIVGTTPVYVSQSPYLRRVQDKTYYIPIGIDKVVPDPEEVLRIKDRYRGKKIIFSLGRLVEYKGYEYLIKATALMSDDYMVLIGGSGPLKEKLQTLIEREGLSGRVELLGFVKDDEVPAYFGACDLFCLSSIQKTEAFGIVQLEAMSVGKPIVATRIKESGVSWVNEHGVSGFNVRPADPKELSSAITYILSNQDVYNKFSLGACLRYNSLFTKVNMIDTSLSVYNCVLNK